MKFLSEVTKFIAIVDDDGCILTEFVPRLDYGVTMHTKATRSGVGKAIMQMELSGNYGIGNAKRFITLTDPCVITTLDTVQVVIEHR